jgi:hypothetical protein
MAKRLFHQSERVLRFHNSRLRLRKRHHIPWLGTAKFLDKRSHLPLFNTRRIRLRRMKLFRRRGIFQRCAGCLAAKALKQPVCNGVDISWRTMLILGDLQARNCDVTVGTSVNFQMRVGAAIGDPQILIKCRPGARANNSCAGFRWCELAIAFGLFKNFKGPTIDFPGFGVPALVQIESNVTVI